VKPFISAILLLVLSVPFAAAQSTRITDEIVVTASALPETVESTPAAVTVITRQDIERRAARDVADLLREVPGLTISRSGSPGKATSLFTRGAASTQTLVLWNGIEINNPYFAGYDWGRFSTLGVEQIEVVRGPFSALYGSEAMAGVVNVLTSPRASGVRGEIAGGAHGLRNAALDAAYVGATMLIDASYEHRQDGGFNANDDFLQNSGNVWLKWTPSSSLSLAVSARRTNYDLGIPFNSNGSAIVPSPERRQDGNESQVALPLQQTLGRFSYDLTLSESRRSDRFRDPQDPFGFTDSTTDSTTRRTRLTTRTLTTAGTIIAGGEYETARVDDQSNFGLSLQNSKRTARSLFLEDRWSREAGARARVELSAGARYDRFKPFGSQTSPRLAVAWVFGGSKIRAAYGEAFRAPSVGELYFPFSGNPKLNAERSRSLEAGYDAALGTDGLLSLTLFSSRFRDLIFFDNQSYTFANIGKVRSDGLELGMKERVHRTIYLAFNYTYLHKNEDESTGERLPRRPEHSGSLALGWRVGAVEANLTLLRSGARADILPVSPYSRVMNRAYTTIDVNLRYDGGHVVPFVELENLRNEKYEEVLGYRSPGRRAIVGLRFH
jgi:vitamin B12 transporter